MLICETTLTVLDFETTGFVPGFGTEPWQVGAIRLVNGRVDAPRTFKSMACVDINRPFNAYAPSKHHKLREEIAAEPEVSNVWEKARCSSAGFFALVAAPNERDAMKRFVLDRRQDETGVSGTGFVAEGVLFDNGKCALAWLGLYRSVTVFDNIDEVGKIHGHDGKTIIRWLD